MKKPLFILLLFVLALSPQLYAQTMSGSTAGTVDSIEIEAATKVTVIISDHGETLEEFEPRPIIGDWSFSWNGNQVSFTGVFDYGDYQTTTDAGGLGGVTRQTFYGFSYNVSGTAQWDERSQTLSYEILPLERDDERASTVTQRREPDCIKIRGMFARKAVAAFLEASPGLEGLKLEFRFNEDRSRFDGQAVLIQYGGKGATKSESTIIIALRGDLAPVR